MGGLKWCEKRSEGARTLSKEGSASKRNRLAFVRKKDGSSGTEMRGAEESFGEPTVDHCSRRGLADACVGVIKFSRPAKMKKKSTRSERKSQQPWLVVALCSKKKTGYGGALGGVSGPKKKLRETWANGLEWQLIRNRGVKGEHR